jgi:hypothetical protein
MIRTPLILIFGCLFVVGVLSIGFLTGTYLLTNTPHLDWLVEVVDKIIIKYL